MSSSRLLHQVPNHVASVGSSPPRSDAGPHTVEHLHSVANGKCSDAKIVEPAVSSSDYMSSGCGGNGGSALLLTTADREVLSRQQEDLTEVRQVLLRRLNELGRVYVETGHKDTQRMREIEGTLRDVDKLRRKVSRCLEDSDEAQTEAAAAAGQRYSSSTTALTAENTSSTDSPHSTGEFATPSKTKPSVPHVSLEDFMSSSPSSGPPPPLSALPSSFHTAPIASSSSGAPAVHSHSAMENLELKPTKASGGGLLEGRQALQQQQCSSATGAQAVSSTAAYRKASRLSRPASSGTPGTPHSYHSRCSSAIAGSEPQTPLCSTEDAGAGASSPSPAASQWSSACAFGIAAAAGASGTPRPRPPSQPPSASPYCLQRRRSNCDSAHEEQEQQSRTSVYLSHLTRPSSSNKNNSVSSAQRDPVLNTGSSHSSSVPPSSTGGDPSLSTAATPERNMDSHEQQVEKKTPVMTRAKLTRRPVVVRRNMMFVRRPADVPPPSGGPTAAAAGETASAAMASTKPPATAAAAPSTQLRASTPSCSPSAAALPVRQRPASALPAAGVSTGRPFAPAPSSLLPQASSSLASPPPQSFVRAGSAPPGGSSAARTGLSSLVMNDNFTNDRFSSCGTPLYNSNHSTSNNDNGSTGPFFSECKASPTIGGSSSSFVTALAAQALREKGNEAFRRQDFASAQQHYTEAIKLDPASDVLYCNRAAVYLLTFRYAAALADCRCVLLRSPDNLKANWRAAKSLLFSNQILEARRYYRTAHRIAEEESGSSKSAGSPNGGAAAARHSFTSMGSASSPSGGHSGHVKWLRDRKAIFAEEEAIGMVETYWQHTRHTNWAEAAVIAQRLGGVFGTTGATSVIWQVRQLEAQLHGDAHGVMERAMALRRQHPTCPDLLYVQAKAGFYCAHDTKATRQSLELLAEAKQAFETQIALVETNLRSFCDHLHATSGGGVNNSTVGTPNKANGSSGANNNSSSSSEMIRSVEEWIRGCKTPEDSRYVQLQRAIQLFAKHRDDGNSAYARADWPTAFAAYTRCLQVDAYNHSLLGTTHCNRAAVCMQSGRWKDALADVGDAIRYNPGNARAYARRARIYTTLFLNGQQQQPHQVGATPTSRDSLLRYLDAAVDDLARHAELAPSVAAAEQLQEARERRRAFMEVTNGGGGGPKRQSAGPREGGAGSAGSGSHSARQRRSTKFYSCDDDEDSDGSSGGKRSGAASRGYSAAGSRPGTSTPKGPRTNYYGYGYGGSAPAGGGGNDGGNAEHQRNLQLLGLSLSLSRNGKVDIKVLTRAYREAALRWHPDKWVSGSVREKEMAEQNFKDINVAYQALKDM